MNPTCAQRRLASRPLMVVHFKRICQHPLRNVKGDRNFSSRQGSCRRKRRDETHGAALSRH